MTAPRSVTDRLVTPQLIKKHARDATVKAMRRPVQKFSMRDRPRRSNQRKIGTPSGSCQIHGQRNALSVRINLR
jgi:hypothetical protein